jgi:hypothetical protein
MLKKHFNGGLYVASFADYRKGFPLQTLFQRSAIPINNNNRS